MDEARTREEWVALLNERLAPALGATAIWSPERPDEVRLLGRGPAGAGCAGLLRRPALVALLERWPASSDLLLSWCGEDRERPVPIALVRDARIWLFGGADDPAALRPREDFEPWFQRSFLRPYPVPALAVGMHRVNEQCWAAGTLPPDPELEGFPYCLSIRGAREYILVGYAGYGLNEWACYFTFEREGARARLRMPFGGVYADIQACAERIQQEIPLVVSSIERCRGRLERVDLADRMGTLAFRYKRNPGSRWVECDSDGEEGWLERAIDLALRPEAGGTN